MAAVDAGAAADMPLAKGSRVFGRDITNLEGAAGKGPGKPKASSNPEQPLQAELPPAPVSPIPHRVEAETPPRENVQHVAEYAEDIFALHAQDETRWASTIRPDYLDQMAEINVKMRAILVDWLIEVHMKFKLQADTLFLCVNLLDRYLVQKPETPRSRLQLIGVTCLFVASKYEEVSPPEVRDFVYVTDQAYTRDDILDCEVSVLNTLRWNVTVTSPLVFLRRYKQLLELDNTQYCLAQYFLELPLPDVRFLQYAPSLLACAAVLLSNKVLKKSPSWPPAVAAVVPQYQEATVKACAKPIVGLLVNDQEQDAQTLRAVKKKFASATYLQVSKLIA
jgi:cyclin B